MNHNRLFQRIGIFNTIGVARLGEHRLVFHKRGGDDSGKCTVDESAGDALWGVVFGITRSQKEILDYYEGVGHGYDAVYKQVLAEDRSLNALLYQARLNALDDGLAPFDWYKDFVLSGARQHGLPMDYIAMIEQVQAISDPDEQRARENRSILDSENTSLENTPYNSP